MTVPTVIALAQSLREEFLLEAKAAAMVATDHQMNEPVRFWGIEVVGDPSLPEGTFELRSPEGEVLVSMTDVTHAS